MEEAESRIAECLATGGQSLNLFDLGLSELPDGITALTIEAATDVADNVHFVEVASAFDGHERCGADPWLYGIDDILGGAGDGDEPGLPPSLARPFHPTGEGHDLWRHVPDLRQDRRERRRRRPPVPVAPRRAAGRGRLVPTSPGTSPSS